LPPTNHFQKGQPQGIAPYKSFSKRATTRDCPLQLLFKKGYSFGIALQTK